MNVSRIYVVVVVMMMLREIIGSSTVIGDSLKNSAGEPALSHVFSLSLSLSLWWCRFWLSAHNHHFVFFLLLHHCDVLCRHYHILLAIPAEFHMISGSHDSQTSADVYNTGQFQLPNPAVCMFFFPGCLRDI